MRHAPIDATGESDGDMTGCADVENGRSSLCHAHCNAQSASFDASHLAQLAMPAIDLVGTAAFARALRPVSDFAPAAPQHPAGALSPPITIRNCCFLN